MNEGNAVSTVHSFPEPDTFKFGDKSFTLDVADTCYVMQGILEEMTEEGKKVDPPQVPTEKEFLTRLIGWLEREKEITLTLGQMEWLNGQLHLHNGRKKKAMREDIESSWR